MESISWLVRPPTRDRSTTGIEAPSPTPRDELQTISRGSTDYSQKPDFSMRSPSHTSTDITSFLPSRSSTRPSSNRSSFIDATVQCPICSESMTTPKQLPCLHNVCKRCLKQYILTHLRKEMQGNIVVQSFPCPVCKEEIQPPNPSADYEKWASMFPTNFFLHAYGMILTVQREEVECDSCVRRKESTLGSWWCRECSEYLCNVCKTVHSGFKIFKHHDVKSIKDIAENPEIAVPKNDSCAEHMEQIIHYCRAHKTPVCGKCVVTSHRKCDTVVPIEDEFNSMKDRGDIAKLTETLREYEQMSTELVEHRKRVIEDLEHRKDEIIQEVHKIRESFEESLRKLENKLLQDFDKFHETETKHLENLSLQYENLGKQISNAVKLVDTVQQSGSESHLVGLIGKISKECKKYKRAIVEGQAEMEEVTYDFQPDNVLKQTLNSVKHLGNIKMKRSSKAPEAVIAGSHNPQNISKAIELRDVRVWISGDRGRCGIVGGVFFDDDKILLADHDNFKLKLFNLQGRPISNLPLKKKPTDIAMISRNKFVVTYPSACAVQFIELNRNIFEEGSSITTARMYFSVACSNQRLYFLSGTGISVSDLEAKEVSFIKLGEHGGPSLLGQGYLKASPEGFIITDTEKNTVSLFTLSGEPTRSFTSKDMKGPASCDVDLHGNIFVCCKNSSMVFQCDSSGERKRNFLTEKDGISNPVVIALQKQNDKFFVASNKISRKDYLQIFQWI